MSFDVRWEGGGDRSRIRDETYGFEGDFVAGPATISFKARNDKSHLEFRSDPDGQDTPNGPAGVGKERNGVFFD